MATQIPVQALPEDGAPLNKGGADNDVTWTASDSTMSFLNDGRTLLMVKNESGGALAVDIAGTTSPDSGRTETETVTVPDGEFTVIGPFKAGNWTNGGRVDLAISSTDPAFELAAVSYTSG